MQAIRNLEALFEACNSKKQDLLHTGHKQNDVRVSFYKHLVTTTNSTIHLMIFSDTTLVTEDWWLKKLPKYKINKRIFSTSSNESRQIETDNIDQYLLLSYFSSVFHIFESSFRRICKSCLTEEYSLAKKIGEWEKEDIKNLLVIILKKLNLLDIGRRDFLEIVVKFRSSLYNNGVYISERQESFSDFKWKNKSYVFKHGERIISEDKGELWEECFKFTRALISIFTEVINHPIIKKYSFIEDITATGYI